MREVKKPIDPSVESDRDLATRIAFAWRELRRGAANNAVREIIFEGDDYSIEPGQFDTLEQLVLHGSISMGNLADALRVDPSTATRAIQRLIKDGLAEKVSHDGDGRVVFVAPSERGRMIHTRVTDQRRNLVFAIVEQFEPEEREVIAASLERFSRALDVAVADLSQQNQ
jgi:DNA-binding MarR family transcriptional regulator